MNDILVRAISKDGAVKATAVYTRALTERARQIHDTTPVATAALGRALAGCAMMGNALKGAGASVTLSIKGNGPLGTVLAVAQSEAVRILLPMNLCSNYIAGIGKQPLSLLIEDALNKIAELM